MKIVDIITEAKMDPGIRRAMAKKGYQFLGKGQDQDVYLEPGSGLILKIFGTDYDSRAQGKIRLSEGQRSFKDFADFCMADPSNPFLPDFHGWETFVYKDSLYLQIRCERLFPIKDAWLGDALYLLSIWVDRRDSINLIYSKALDDVGTRKLIMLLGEDGFKQLLTTMQKLERLAHRKGYVFDLHERNFMLGSDGQVVINDPFFTGAWRSE